MSFLLIIVIQLIFPAIKIPLRFYNRIYSLLNFSTAHLDLAKLMTYVLLLICGFAFVNLVNLKNKRDNPLIGPNGYSDTKKVVLFGFIIFFVSANFLIMGKFDFEGFCRGAAATIKNTSDYPLDYFNKLYDHYPYKINRKETTTANTEEILNLRVNGNHQINKQIEINSIANYNDDNQEIAENQKQFNRRKNHQENLTKNYNRENAAENDGSDMKEVYTIKNNDLYNNNNNNNKNNYKNNDKNYNKKDLTFQQQQNKNSFMFKKSDIGFFKKLTYSVSIGLYAFTKNFAEYFKPEFYFKSLKTECKYPVFFERVFQNYFFFILPFILGLNFTYLDDIPELQKFNLTWDDMKNWGWDLWTVFAALCLFIFFTIGFLFYSLIQTSLLRFIVYLVFLAALLVYVLVRTNKEQKHKKHFHLHHYALMLVLNLLLGVHHDYFMVLLGAFSGIMVEGSCRWGVSSCWNDDE